MRYPLFLLCLLFRCCCLQAQVFVHEEPRHHPEFQNDKMRILNVLLPPGDTTQYHIHHTPSLFLFFINTTTGSQLQGAAPTVGHSAAGAFLFENLAAPHVRVHRVWNIDKDPFHVMDIELLSTDSGFTRKPLALPHGQLVIDTPWVRTYRITLEASEAFSIQDERSFVLIAMDAIAVEGRQAGKRIQQSVKPGTFFQLAQRQGFTLKNVGRTVGRFALIELP